MSREKSRISQWLRADLSQVHGQLLRATWLLISQWDAGKSHVSTK